MYPRSTIKTIVDTFLQTGRTAKLPRGGSHNRRLEAEHLDWLTDHLDEFAGHPVRWLTTQLNEHFQFDPPISQRAVDKALNKLTTYTLKLMRIESERYNDPEYIEERQRWAQNVLHGPGDMSHFVYIDEAGFNLHISRKYGRAPQGRRAFLRVPYNRGPNFSLIAALDSTGILASHFKLCAYNQETLIQLLQTKLFPAINERRRIIVMDNVPFYKTGMVRNAIAAAGHTLLYLPPYSPHLNAVESVFSSMKNHVRQQVVQEETLAGHVLDGIRRITAAMARGRIREVNRNFALALNGSPLGRLYDVRHALPEGYQDPYIEGWDEEQVEEEEEEEVDEAQERDDGHEINGEEERGEEEEEGNEEGKGVSDEEDDSQEDEMAAALAPAPLHVKIERKYSPPRNRSGRVRI